MILDSFLTQHEKWNYDSIVRASDQTEVDNNFEKRKDGLTVLYYHAELNEK
jgi:hypothetical protein